MRRYELWVGRSELSVVRVDHLGFEDNVDVRVGGAHVSDDVRHGLGGPGIACLFDDEHVRGRFDPGESMRACIAASDARGNLGAAARRDDLGKTTCRPDAHVDLVGQVLQLRTCRIALLVGRMRRAAGAKVSRR
ncbi:hypothetical protein L1887_53963 [Cichorium endivia]|nr:hypothetical protein L1887_53963 [Cichorium endivia]